MSVGPADRPRLHGPRVGDPVEVRVQGEVVFPGSTDVATQADIRAGFSRDPYFVTTPDGQRVQFWARLDASTLGGSSFSRAELREVNADGTDPTRTSGQPDGAGPN